MLKPESLIALLTSVLTCVFSAHAPQCAWSQVSHSKPSSERLLVTEKLGGDGVWVDPAFERRRRQVRRLDVKVWFDEQLLGDGRAYWRRAKEFAGRRRRELRTDVVKTLKWLSDKSYKAAKQELDRLIKDGKISNLERHWIVNGFSCTLAPESLNALKSVKGVKKVFVANRGGAIPFARGGEVAAFKPTKRAKFDPNRYKHPWYIRYLQADKVWKKFGVTGRGTMNVVHDFNFVFSDNVNHTLYRNPNETPGNGNDDDGNGLIDDYHGFDFDRRSANLTTRPVPLQAASPQGMHGFMCAAIICGAGVEGKEFEFGIAPEGSWSGVIASRRLEAAVQWAVEHNADTYSMSFSVPNLGEYRSHWRKLMEHGSFCGVYFVSGAGNFAQTASIPVQMRTPEDIPDVVFAAAGVQRNFTRTRFSSKGPVNWETEHYRDGLVQKPEVCAFNVGLPILLRNGTVRETGLGGNSFAGPMFCGAIALMLSADPDLLPWDLKQIIISTATDVAAGGVDDETGHGLINCYRAVKEVLRRKASRDGEAPKPYEGREDGDTLDIKSLQAKLKSTKLKVARVQPGSQAAKLGVKPGDVFVSYNGQKIHSRRDMPRAKTAAANLKSIAVVIRQAEKSIELKFKPGPLGIILIVEYDEPTFQ